MPRALIILAEGFEDIEAVTTIDLLRRAGIDVTVAGLGSLQITGSRGKIKVICDTKLSETKDNYDAIILPGGMPGAKNLAESKEVKELIANIQSRKKLIAAICAAPAVVLAPLGILDNKKATCFKGMEKNFNSSIKFTEEKVAVDGNIITSRGAGTAFDFGLAIIKALTDDNASKEVAEKTLFI